MKRSLTLSSVIAISIGGMLGSGIFVLPGLAAAKTGPSVWLAYILAAVCVLPAAISKSELATAMPSSGGAYVYIERAFGPLFGTISGIGLWLSILLKSSFALVGFGAYLSVLVNIDPTVTKYVALISLVGILFLNIFGVKKVGKVQTVIVIISITALGILTAFALPKATVDTTIPFLIDDQTGLIATIAFVYLSYAGVTKVAAIAGEIKNPSRNLPIAMMASLFLTASIYVFVAYALVHNLPLESLQTDIHPIYTLSESIGGKIAGYIAAVVGVLTLISGANSGVLASSRFPFAMARDKLLPKFLAKIHPKHMTPVITIVLTCVIMAIVILFLDVVKIAKLASAFLVLIFISMNVAVIILRETSAQWYQPTYKSPLYPLVQIFGLVSGVVLLVYLGMLALVSILLIVALGYVIYRFFGKNALRTGVLRDYGHRPAVYLFYKKGKTTETQTPKLSPKPKLDDNLVSKAGAIVPLLGNETSVEALVEMAAAMNKRDKIQAVNITEVPNQTFLDAVSENTPRTAALQRRIKRLSDPNQLDIDFEAVVTHELSNTIHALSDQTHCDWLVMGWNGRAHNGILVRNPIGWLLTNINSDFALFKDNGVRHFSKVLLALRPGRKDKNFIAIADRICKFYGASLTLLHVVPEKAANEVVQKMKAKSETLLQKATVNNEVVIIASNNPVKTVSKQSSSYDLLILGTPEKDNWLSVLFGTGKDKFTDNSECSVLRLTMKSKGN
ncbi:MAG: amino acid permease [Flavobacteriaceae bacterium]|nr:amino acid permease [Flavobacteriaceae bacterium]MDG2314744.1 amino acid permease [Flavobacteriaceae bacterium]